MRTTLDIDGRLLREAVRYANTKTKKEAVERGLRELINAERRRRLIAMHGTGYGMTLAEFLRTRRDE
jgi:Arc/MetJ family transcription regulator